MYGMKSGVVGSKTPYGVSGYEEAKARVKHQTLMQDYEKLLKETAVMRTKLETAKKKKLILAAEVRFLGRRHKQLLDKKNLNSWAEQTRTQPTNSGKQTGKMKAQFHSRNPHRLPPVPEMTPKKKRCNGSKVTSNDGLPTSVHAREKIPSGGKESSRHRSTPNAALSSDLKQKGKLHSRKEAGLASMSPFHDNIYKERLHAVKDAAVRNSIAGFDLNVESNASWKEASTSSLASRTPIFDLNEISTGEEDFTTNIIGVMRFEEAKRSVIGNTNDDQHNSSSDLKLSVCRNAGEGSSRAGKRKISWQDPVALRV